MVIAKRKIMQGLLLPELWAFSIAPLLRVRDLCALRAVSRACAEFWSSDRVWQAQRARLCCYGPGGPALKLVFDAHSSSGIYHVFSKILTLGFNMPGLKRLLRQKTSDDAIIFGLVCEILRAHIPRGELCVWEKRQRRKRTTTMLPQIMGTMANGSYISFDCDFNVDYPYVEMTFAVPGGKHYHSELYAPSGFAPLNWFFVPWVALVCQHQTVTSQTTPLFRATMDLIAQGI